MKAFPRLRPWPAPTRPGQAAAFAVFASATALWYCLLLVLGDGIDPAGSAEELRAARGMETAIRAIGAEAEARGITIDADKDPNRTGLVGLPWSGLTTTLGSLPAKRTGAQPDAAALLARLLREAGVRSGDLVAVDSSGSFPGFAIAALVASETLGAQPVIVVSVGSSTWGANRPEFTLVDMLEALERRGMLRRGAAALSPGGGGDSGEGMDEEALRAVQERARGFGAALLHEPELRRNIAARRRVFEESGEPAALVSIGGNYSQAGPGERLSGRTGLLRPSEFPRGGPEGEGLVQDFLRAGKPVIRILDVKDLCARTGLAYDPVPWPAPGRSSLRRLGGPSRLLTAAGPLAALVLAVGILSAAGRRRGRGADR